MNYKFVVTILCLITLVNCQSRFHPHEVDYKGYEIKAKNLQEDQAADQLIRPFRELMDAQMEEVLVVSTADLRLGKPESTMGNFASDATEFMAEKITGTEVHFAFHNYTGIRVGSVGKGDVTLGRVYEMLPFDNYLVTVTLSGNEVEMLCDFLASKGGWPTSSSLTFRIENDLAEEVRIDGKAIDKQGQYIIATNDYIIESANYQDYLSNKEMNNTNIYVRDAVADYLRLLAADGKKLHPAKDKRVTKS